MRLLKHALAYPEHARPESRLGVRLIASAISGSADKRLDIHTVTKITGTSVRMIEQHYGKLLQDDARERLNRIAFA